MLETGCDLSGGLAPERSKYPQMNLIYCIAVINLSGFFQPERLSSRIKVHLFS